MQIGFVGLGKMGKGLVQRILSGGHEVVAYNRTEETVDEIVKLGAKKATSLKQLVQSLTGERVVFLMLPAGEVTINTALELAKYLKPNDLIIDGANSNFKKTLELKEKLKLMGIGLVDAGISGGPKGAKDGACVMVGGDKPLVDKVWPIFVNIAAPQALLYCGNSGAGHFVKMVHNGIEYGMMQAIAEGAAVLKAAPYNLDLIKVFDLYNNTSVIESRLVGWTAAALKKDVELKNISSIIEASGEGEWTVQTAKELKIPVPVIEKSLEIRRESRSLPENFRNKVVSAIRGEFGGHKVIKD